MEYQRRINAELLGLDKQKDYIQGNTPTNMLVGGGPLNMGRVPSGNSTADLVLAGSVAQDNGGMTGGSCCEMCGGSKFTKGFARGFTNAAKGTFKTVKKIVKPVVGQVKKDYKAARKQGVGMLQDELSSAYGQGKQALADEAMAAMMGAGLKSVSKGLSKTAKKVSKPVSKQMKQDVRAVKKSAKGQPSMTDVASSALLDVYTQGKRDLASRAVGGARGQSAWISHVKAYQAKHGCSYKDAMKGAKASYP